MVIGIDGRVLQEGQGGVFTYTKNLLHHLVLAGEEHQFKIFLNQWKILGADRQDFIAALASRKNVKIYKYTFPSKLLNFSLRFFSYPHLDDLIEGCDLFFLPAPMYCSFSRKARVILGIHDLSFKIYPEFFTIRQNLWHRLLNFPKLLSRAQKIIAVSENTKRDIIGFYKISASKIKVIYSGVNEKFFAAAAVKPDPEKLREKYNLPKNRKFILCVGTLEPRKNHLALLRAFAAWQGSDSRQAREYDLLIVGHRGWKNKGVLSHLKNLAPAGRVHSFFDCGRNNILDFYRLANFFVYPSFYEGFGLPIVEAMAAGLPVITSVGSSLPEVVGNCALLVDPHRPDDLLAALQTLAQDGSLYAKLKEKGINRAREFTWEKTARETLKQLTTDS